MSERIALLLFRLAARGFPRVWRARHQEEMAETFRHALRARHDPLRRSRFIVHAVFDVARAGVRERLSPVRPSPRLPVPPFTNRSQPMRSLFRDFRYGVRSLRKSPAFTAIAALTIGLGLGANAAIFSVLNAVLLRPLPFPEPERLVSLWETRLDRGFTQATFSRANFWDVHDQNRTLSGMAALESRTINLTGRGYPERLILGRVNAEFFSVLGVTPRLGRLFTAGEDAPGAPATGAVLSHRAWTAYFGQEADIVGRPITLDGETRTVIGVLPPGEPWLNEADVFLPMIRNPAADRGSWELQVIARLKPGVTPASAAADLNAIAGRLAETFPRDDKGMGIAVDPSTSWVASDTTRRALWVLMGSVGFLLLIACVNLANLFLARATGRSRERVLRAALGASRARLVSQTLAESLLVSGLGAAMGLVMAFGMVRGLKAWNPGGIPRLAEVGISGWVLGFTALVTVVTALLSGIVPAILGSHVDLASALREGDRSVGGGRAMGKLRGGLVALEVAASIALLIGAGLLLRSFQTVLGEDRGFKTENRVIAEVALPRTYDSARTAVFIRTLTERLGARPGIRSVAGVSIRPLTGTGTGMGFWAADKPDPAGEVPWAGWRLITKGYFKTLGVPILSGRDFTEGDFIGKPWRVIISKRLADMMWPGENAVGRTLTLWKGQSNDPAEVIGVAADVRAWALAEDPSLAVYFPYYGTSWSPLQLVIETGATADATQQSLRSVLGEIDSSLPVGNVRSLESLVGSSVASRRFTLLLLGAFAVVALVLALAGIYGVLSYAVTRRTSEIGVRLALGASPRKVLGLIVAQGMRPVLVGAAIGVVGAIWLTKLMRTLLYGVSTTDVVTYGGVTLVLAAAALVSCYWPARQAVKVDVVAALRQE
jgi:putative ABC transport system permease protein